MIGRKILDRVDDLLDVPDLPTSRYLQPPPLRINTSTRERMVAGSVLRERTNSIVNPFHPPAISICTPNSSLTFGMPNPTTYYPNRAGSSCGSSSEAGSRSRRYSDAEEALASALKASAGGRSQLELQIFALYKASAVLNTRAKESRERAAKLKLSLAERDTDPVTYVALQKERWMEEKRLFAVDQEVETLTQQLSKLKADHTKGRYEEENRDPPALSNEARRSANLGRFLDYSPTKTSFPLNHKCRLVLDESFPRRMTMSDVSPLRLRPSSITPPLRRLATKHARPSSMAGEPFNPVKRPCRLRPGNPTSDAPSLINVAEHPPRAQFVSDCSVSSRSSARLATDAPYDGSESYASPRPSTPPLSVASEGSLSSQGVGEESGGIATIISHVSARTRSEILADLDKDDIHVPDYAMNLLGGFDLIHDDFALPDRELFIKPLEVEPIEVAPPPEEVPPPSEESDTGPYTSFALPRPTIDSTWSRISLSTPTWPSTPNMHRPSLQPLTPDSSSFSRSSTPSTPRASKSSKGPRPRHSLLFYMRKHRSSLGGNSPASSSVRVDSVFDNSPSPSPSKKRFSLFSRKQ